jgi:hypothetical protein
LERDRVAAYMVRAAASGAFNYAKADPYNRQWRLRHLLILREVARNADEQILAAVHDHWLAYVSHSQLEEGSWSNAKRKAADALETLRRAAFPWIALEETADKKDTINSEYGDLIAQYRRMVESKKAEKVAQNNSAGS